MKNLKKFALLVAVGLVSLGAWAGAITICTEMGDEIRCKDQSVAMNTIQNGSGPVTLRLEENLVLSNTFDFSWIDRDITLALNGRTLTVDEGNDEFEGELINIELQYGRTERHYGRPGRRRVSDAPRRHLVR